MKFISDLFGNNNKMHLYFKFTVFTIMHWYRMFLLWLHKKCVQPIENNLKKYNKSEPEENQWMQFYMLTCSSCTDQLDLYKDYYGYFDKISYPYIKDFDAFIKKEYDLFADHQLLSPPYDDSTFQVPETLETLIVIKNEDLYLFRTFTQYKKLDRDLYQKFPSLCNFNFLVVEYSHPELNNSIELYIPNEYYLEGNELFTPAFVQRFLELMNVYYVFDTNYEINIIDHKLENVALDYNNYIVIEKNGYTIKKNTNESIMEKENEDEKTSSDDNNFHQIDPSMNIIFSDIADDDSILSTEGWSNKFWPFW